MLQNLNHDDNIPKPIGYIQDKIPLTLIIYTGWDIGYSIITQSHVFVFALCDQSNQQIQLY